MSPYMSFDADSHSFGLIITFFSTAVVAKYVRPTKYIRKRKEKNLDPMTVPSQLVLVSTHKDKRFQLF